MKQPTGAKPKKFTKEQLVMHGLWRKAMAEDEVTLRFDTEADARKIRFDLYNSVRLVRLGKVFDEELSQAVEDCSISLDGQTLRIRKKFSTGALLAVLKQTGIDPNTQQQPGDEIDAAAEESQQKMLALLGGLAPTPTAPEGTEPPPRVTPYYTRRG